MNVTAPLGWRLSLLSALIFALGACSSSDGSEGGSGSGGSGNGDAGQDADAPLPDAQADTPIEQDGASEAGEDAEQDVAQDVAPTVIDEIEPNDSVPTAQPVTLPQVIRGTVADPVDSDTDEDVFSFEAPPGTYLSFQVVPTGSSLQPMVSVGVSGSVNGYDTFLELWQHAAPDSETTTATQTFLAFSDRPAFYVGVRDARNVPGGDGPVGGSDFGYELTARTLPLPTPVEVTGSQMIGELPEPGAIAFFSIPANAAGEALVVREVSTEMFMRSKMYLYDKDFGWMQYNELRKLTYVVEDPNQGPFLLAVGDELSRGAPGMTFELELVRAPLSEVPQSCAEAVAVTAPGTWYADSTYSLSHYNPDDNGSCPGGGAFGVGDHFYRVHLTAGQKLTATVTSLDDLDPAVFLLQGDCAAADLKCVAGSDDTVANETEVLTYEAIEDGDFFLVVDGYGSDGGVYEITLAIQ